MSSSYHKIKRTYTFSPKVMEQTALGNRSDFLRKAVAAIRLDPKAITRALSSRLSTEEDRVEDNVRTTVMVDIDTLETLDSVSKKSGLPVEIVLRLALEDFMSKMK